MNNITVIGGSGFIGTRLCSRIKKNSNFVIFDLNQSSLFPGETKIGDVRSTEDLRDHILPGGTLINLAAEHKDNVFPISLYDEVNVNGAKNICDLA